MLTIVFREKLFFESVGSRTIAFHIFWKVAILNLELLKFETIEIGKTVFFLTFGTTTV